jgi:hypothetical protein
MLPPPKEPMTPREVVHLILGDEHVDHTVAQIAADRPLTIECSCGVHATLTSSDARAFGTKMRTIRDALVSAPRFQS